GIMTAVYRMNHDGWDAERAYAEMKRYGFESGIGHGSLKDYVFEYYAQIEKNKEIEVRTGKPGAPNKWITRSSDCGIVEALRPEGPCTSRNRYANCTVHLVFSQRIISSGSIDFDIQNYSHLHVRRRWRLGLRNPGSA